MDKIKLWLQDSRNLHTTIRYTIQIAILALVLRLTFWSNATNRVIIDRHQMADTIAILKHQLKQIDKQDSILLHNEKQMVTRIYSMPTDSVASIISNHIARRQMLHSK